MFNRPPSVRLFRAARPGPAIATRTEVRWRLALVAGLALGLAVPGASWAGELTLTLLHTNDLHARLEPVTIDGSRCLPTAAAQHRCYGGIARVAGEIERRRGSEPNPLVLDAGDRFQGSLFYYYYKSAALKPFFNLIGYQALTLGNHEFDDGPAELARFLTGLTVPVISANVEVADEPLLAGRFGGSLVVSVGGERIGLIGLTTPATATNAKPGPHVRFTDPIAAARSAVAALHADGVRRIIAISHLGLTDDLALAASVDGIAVIVGGHSHTLLRTDDTRALGPSPRVATAPSGAPVLIVQAYFAGIYLGHLQVTLDDAGVPTAWQGQPILLDDNVAEDPTARSFVEALAKPLGPLLAQQVGNLATALAGDRQVCRFAECLLGDVVADALLDQTRAQGTQIALINGGALRASLPAGALTLGQILEVLPFANTLSTFSLTGADLAAALEFGLAVAHDPTANGTGRFPQVAGLRLHWSATRPPGQRLVSVEVRQPDGSFAPLDPAVPYPVVSIDFLRGGGDGYTVLRDHAIDPYDGGALVSDTLAAYLAAHSPLSATLEGRIVRDQ